MDNIVSYNSWDFLKEATQEEMNLLISVVSHCCKADINELNMGNIIPRIIGFRNLKEDSTFEAFLKDIGEESDCDPQINWDLYPYMILVSMLRNAMMDCTAQNIKLIAKEFQLSNATVAGMTMELRSRIISNSDFRRSFPFVLASILGINWRDSIRALPIVSSVGISSSLMYSKESLMLAVVLGPLAKPITSFSNFLNGLFSTKISADQLFPVVALLVLLYQEHTSVFNNNKEVIEYVENCLRTQNDFENTSKAAMSLMIQILQPKQEDDVFEICNSVLIDVLHDKRFTIPKYRLDKMIPFKESVINYLAEWVIEDDKTTDEFLFQIAGKHPKSNMKEVVSEDDTCKHHNEITDLQTDNVEQHLISELQARISVLEEELKEAKETFAFLRHDVKSMYATSVAPLFQFLDGIPLDNKTVEKALEKEAIVSNIINNVGKSDFGLRSGIRYSLKSITESAMASNNYTFVWNHDTVDSLIEISEFHLKNRVLANIRSNFERCAFGVSPYSEMPISERIVEAYISEDNEYVLLTVSNNGMPISENETNIIFDNGVSLGARPSTGHGLAYVRKFMNYWEGSVEAVVPKNNFNISFIFKFKK